MILLVVHIQFMNMGRKRKYCLNENYFNKIDTPEKAYIVGFIYADGSVSDKYLTITIKNSDIEILEFIRTELEYGGMIYSKQRGYDTYASLSIYSKKICDSLINIGVIRNKTYESKILPIVPNKLFNSFLLGFFDGDGSIYSSQYNNRNEEYGVCFSNNIYVLTQLKQILLEKQISSCNIRLRDKNSIYSGMLEIRGSRNIDKLQDLLYTDTLNFSLKRKKEKFEAFNVLMFSLRRNFDDILMDNIKNQYLSGKKQFLIAEDLNLPKSSVRGVIQRLRKNGKVK